MSDIQPAALAQPSRSSRLKRTDSLQLDEHCLSLLEIPRVKALGEAAVDGCKHIERIGTLALIHPKPGQVGCRAKLERSRLLAASRSQSLVEQRLHLGIRCAAHEQRACL